MTESLDILRELTNLDSAIAAEATRNRPKFRHPAQDWEGNVSFRIGPKTVGSQTWQCLYMDVTNFICTRSVSPVENGQTTIELNLPKGTGEFRLDKEEGKMLLSARALDANVTSFADLNGRHIKVVEDGFPGQLKSFGEWKDAIVPYYKIIALGSRSGSKGSQNGAVAPISREVLDIASDYCNTKNDDDLAGVASTLKGLQEAGIAFTDPANAALQSAVVNRQLREYLAAQLVAAV